MGKKKKKSPKVEKVFEGSSVEEQSSVANNEQEEVVETKSNIDEFLGIDETQDDGLTEKQREKAEKLKNVQSKISRILQSSNIEIIDENFGDEYESDGAATSDEKSQQDYDSLKSLFGDRDKNKSQELTLTIDDFDYTYVGQYLDEYDLMNMKNITRIRLQRKYPKHLKKVLIIAASVVVVALGAYLGYYFTRDVPVYLKNVTLSQTEHDYYVDELFDYTGLYLIAEYSDGSIKKVPLNNSHLTDITGRVERVGDDGTDIQFVSGAVDLTFQYQGFNVVYNVKVNKKVESGLQAIFSNGIFNLQAGDFIFNDKLIASVDYGNYGKESLSLSNTKLSLYIGNTKCSYVANKGFKVNEQTTKDTVFKLKYVTEKNETIELEIKYEDGKNVTNVKL